MCDICGCGLTEDAEKAAEELTQAGAPVAPTRDELISERKADAQRDFESADWQKVLRRNVVERLKREKFPLDIRAEIPKLAGLSFEQASEGDAMKRALLSRRMAGATPSAAPAETAQRAAYETISEEDVVRLQWWGLYHDKPRVGYFMMRIKIPGGIMGAQQVRTVGAISEKWGRNFGELSTRQNIQLHWIRLDDFEAIFQLLESNALTTVGACGDTVRNITGCPLTGLAHDAYFDVRPTLRQFADFFYGNREYSDLPRKHKITIAACPSQCNAPDFHCIALIGALHPVTGEPGYTFRVGGGLSSAPRIAKDLEIFVPQGEALAVTRAILDVWREEPRYRLSRVKARIKFMVDELGAEGVRAEVVRRVGHDFERIATAVPAGDMEHSGVIPERTTGRSSVHFPVHMGLVNGAQMRMLADVLESYGGEMRLTRQQNFILSGIPADQLDRVIENVARIGFPLTLTDLRSNGIGCTGQPLCNFAVATTKGKLDGVIKHLEEKFGDVPGLRVQVDGCPHACAQHWIADIGLQGTTTKERGPNDEKIEAYEIYLRGGVGRDPQIGRAIVRRVADHNVNTYVERLVRAYLDERTEGERFNEYTRRKDDAELVAIASGGATVAAAAEDAEEVEE